MTRATRKCNATPNVALRAQRAGRIIGRIEPSLI